MQNFNRPTAKIIGTGSYLPERVLTNSDLEKMVDTNDEWIISRTGMRERRIARADEFTSDMGLAAAHKALEAAQMAPENLDLVLFATFTPDYIFPTTACLIQSRLGAVKAAAVDVSAACTGYLYTLGMAKAFIESGIYKNILIIAADKLSSVVNYKDRNTCILFGDGAAAAVISSEGKGLVIRDISLGADGQLADLISQPAGGSRNPATHETVDANLHYIHMEGKEVFKHAVRRMEMASREVMEKAGLKEEDISWLVPHQANIRIIEALAKRFEFPMEKVFVTIHKYGNTSASALGIALDELLRQKTAQPGENILLTAFGAGLTWGSSVLSHE
jgi:3-oxoacyl-[acyl-carrier-protein] synthase-3